MGIITKIDKNGFKVNMEEFYSCKDVVETSNTRRKLMGGFDRTDIDSWHGASNWEEIENLMIYGYKTGIEKFKKTLNQKIQRQAEKRITFKNDVLGFVPIVPLALKCVPNSMLNSNMKTIKTKVLKVVYNVNYGAGASPSDIEENGRKLLSALMHLELKGYRIELSVAYICGGRSKGFDCMKIRVKEANQPFTLQRMMYPIVHPSMFRTIGFDWETRFPHHILTSAGHGCSPVYEYDEDVLKKFVEELFGKDTIMFCGKDIHENGEDYIEEVLTKESKGVKHGK